MSLSPSAQVHPSPTPPALPNGSNSVASEQGNGTKPPALPVTTEPEKKYAVPPLPEKGPPSQSDGKPPATKDAPAETPGAADNGAGVPKPKPKGLAGLGGVNKFKKAITKVKVTNKFAKHVDLSSLSSLKTELHDSGDLQVNLDKDELFQAVGFRRAMTVAKFLELEPESGDEWAYNRWMLGHFMESVPVKIFLTTMIILNAISIGIEADHGDPEDSFWVAIETTFLIIFTVELTLNLTAFGWVFFEDVWRWLDAFVVVVSLLDMIITMTTDSTSSSGLSVIRLVRVVRVLRVVSVFEKMVYLVNAFLAGMQNVMWVLLLLGLVLYIAGVLAQSFFGQSGELQQELLSKGYDVADLFGTVPRSMITLVGLATYDNAVPLQRAVGNVFPQSWAFFMIFLVFVSIGCMELMTSLFIDSLMQEKKRMEKRYSAQVLKQRKHVADLMTGLFRNFDKDSNGALDKLELDACMRVFQDPDTKDLMDHVGIDSSMMSEAIAVADINADGCVTESEFRTALLSISEPPMKADIRAVHQGVNLLKNEITHLTAEMKLLREDIKSMQKN